MGKRHNNIFAFLFTFLSQSFFPFYSDLSFCEKKNAVCYGVLDFKRIILR